MAFLDDLMHQTPTFPPHAQELVTKVLGRDFSSAFGSGELDIDAYLAYHRKQCNHALHDGGRHILVRTHREILEIAADLTQGFSKECVRRRLSPKYADSKLEDKNDLLDSSIDLSARLVSMMNIGTLQYGFSGRKELVWDQGSLQDFLRGHFSGSVMLGQDIKLEKIFNACNLDRIAGMKVEWTDNLADHLRVMNDERSVAIFHHASFLKRPQSVHLFPPGLAEETLRTLALLFPQSDKETTRWAKKITYSLRLDGQLTKCGRLRTDDRQIENFRFWHDRLVILKEIFDESRPSTLSQWWYDRRNGVQWYTFWVAIIVLFLTVFFGVVQSIEGALQVYKAYHPTETCTRL